MSADEGPAPRGHGRHREATRRRADGRRQRTRVQVRENRPRTRRLLADLPHPSLSALAGVVILLLVAAGAVHLSTRGTAVPLDPTVTASGGTLTPAGSSDGGGGESPPTTTDASPAAATENASAPAPNDASDEASGEVVVHVSGAVAKPGVVRLPTGSRVDDALRAVGGAADGADLDRVNLARPLTDGEHIQVPMPGEELPAEEPGAPSASDAPSVTGGAGAAGSGDASGTVDLNRADATELETLPGVGPAIAQRIIDYRETNGAFASVDQLEEVSGIGPATLEKLHEKARV